MIIDEKYYDTIEIIKPNSTSNILFIHGFTTDYNKHLFIKDYLPNDVSFYALNLPGSGKTPPYITTFNSRENYAKLIANYVIKLDLKNIIIIAHSMGGSITAFLSGLISDRIIGYILESPENVSILKNESIIIGEKGASIKDNFTKIKNFVFKSKNITTVHKESNEHKALISFLQRLAKHPMLIKINYDLAAKKYLEPSVTKTNDFFKNFNKPTMIMLGKFDHILLYDLSYKNFDALKNKYFKFIKFNNAGHCIYHDARRKYLLYVLTFIFENNFSKEKTDIATLLNKPIKTDEA